MRKLVSLPEFEGMAVILDAHQKKLKDFVYKEMGTENLNIEALSTH
jgi:hypothetical protein